MNEPWICPRCKRVNAPFNPSCFCKPEDLETSVKSSDEPSDHLTDAMNYLNPPELYKILEAEKRKRELANGFIPNFYNATARCFACNGFHANGQACATLQNNLPPNGEFI